MNPTEELNTLKKKALKKIEQAAIAGETGKLQWLSQAVSKIENLANKTSDLEEEINELKMKVNEDSSEMTSQPLINFKNKDLSDESVTARQRGKLRREEFISDLEKSGIELKRVKGSLFKTKTGKKVGVAYASERQEDRWFLGLPADKFDHAVLLCEKNNGEVQVNFLPEKFFEEYGSHLSESNNQLKFNVRKDRNNYYLVIPDVGSVKIDKYLNELSNIV